MNRLVESTSEAVLYQLETKTGRPGYHPKMMLKGYLYAYTQNKFSGQKIEGLMTDSIRMMWLAHYEVLSYRPLNRFRVTPHMATLLQ